jgi:serine/threonine protein kinase
MNDSSPSEVLSPATSSQMEKIRREIAIMKKCIHPNVVQLYEVIDDPNSDKVYIVLEYLAGGEIKWKTNENLSNELATQPAPLISEAECRQIFRDVLIGLEYLHSQGIIHRDVKPANLLRGADGRVKLSDFGVSHFSERQFLVEQKKIARRKSALNIVVLTSPFGRKHKKQHKASQNEPVELDATDNEELSKTAGSPAFFAPELCYLGDENEERPPVTKAIDVWALGVTLYCLFFGHCPFVAASEFELFEIIPVKQLEFPDTVEIDQLLVDLLQKLLTKDPGQRITLAEAKRHPWTLHGLPNPDVWIKETDPIHYEQVNVTEDEVNNAFTSLMDRLRKQIRRISSSFQNIALLRKRHTHSMPHVHGDGLCIAIICLRPFVVTRCCRGIPLTEIP